MKAAFIQIILNLILLCLTAAPVFTQDLRGSRVTVGVGGGFPISGYRTVTYHNAPTILGEYELPLFRYLSAEVGIENMLSRKDNSSRFGITESRERVTFLPFGVLGTIPFANHRFEVFAGTGGAYVWFSASDDSLFSEGMLWQGNVGGRVALDSYRRYWIGTTLRFYRDVGRPTQQWLSLTAKLTFRFGR